MEDRHDPRAEYERARERLLRRATLATAGFFGAAVVVAVGGAALIAGMLSGLGLPFRTTWLVIASVLLAVPLAALPIRRLRRRREGRPHGRHEGEREDVGEVRGDGE